MTNGVGAGYDDRADVKIHSGSGTNPVTYTVSGGGVLYIKEGTRYLSDPTSYIKQDDSGTLVTSSGADVWLEMKGKSNTVTAMVTSGPRENQGVYIFGRPTLKVATPEDSLSSVLTTTTPLNGDPGSVTPDAIMVAVYDQTAEGTVNSTAVSGVRINFKVADTSVTGGYLIPSDQTSPPVVDFKNNEMENADVPAAARTLDVRTDGTNAVVDFSVRDCCREVGGHCWSHWKGCQHLEKKLRLLLLVGRLGR